MNLGSAAIKGCHWKLLPHTVNVLAMIMLQKAEEKEAKGQGTVC